MKILLIQTLTYLLSSGGAHKANRLLAEGLVERGHTCWVVAPGTSGTITNHPELLAELDARGIEVLEANPDVVVYIYRGVKVYAILSDFQVYTRMLFHLIHEFGPDWTLVSEDRTFLLVEFALEATPSRVVLIAHSQATLPFGPASFYVDPDKTQLLHRVAGILAVSRYLQDYIKRWGGFDSTVIPFPSYGNGPFPRLARFDAGAVTMINPSAIKGISIFLALARLFPATPFAAVPTWATTDADLAALRALPNMQIIPPMDDLNALFAQVRVLVVPSLWGESFGQVVIDAMLRGVPVLASHVGGLPEAKLGVDYTLPVQPIQQYEEQFDVRSLPVPIIPPQNIEPWQKTLQNVLSNRVLYERLSDESRNTALAFVGGLSIDTFENYLQDLAPAPHIGDQPTNDESSDQVLQKQAILEAVAELSPQRRALLMLQLRQRGNGLTGQQPISAVARDTATLTFPLSFSQERLWFLNQLDSANPFYNLPALFRLSGAIDGALLEQSVNMLVLRHEVLRTVFVLRDGQPQQVIQPNVYIPVEMVDTRDQAEAQQTTLLLEHARQLFALDQGPLLRVLLLRVADESYQMLITMHHIVCDGWSISVIVEELGAIYNALLTDQTLALPALPIQYADFAVWQRQHLDGNILAHHLAYWQAQFKDPVPLLDLPTDRPRPAVKAYHGAVQLRPFPTALHARLDQLSRQAHATMFMTVLAAFYTLLYRYSGQTDLVIGTPVAGRHRQEVEKLIGCFINTLPLRIRLDGELSFSAFIASVRHMALEAYAHQDLPLEKLIETLNLERNLSHNPLFQVVFSLPTVQTSTAEMSNGTIRFMQELNPGTSKFDLTLGFYGKEVSFEYDSDLFDESTISRFHDHFLTMLEGIADNPNLQLDDLPLLPATERQQVLIAWNRTNKSYPREQPVHALLQEQADRTPDAIALEYGSIQLTYKTLHERANQLAWYLQKLGVQPADLVGVCVERSPDLVIALLGVLKAGGAYVPLDSTYPTERLAGMLNDAQVKLVLTQTHLKTPWSDMQTQVVCLDAVTYHTEAPTPPIVPITADYLAYIIYTSGSTGQPKGVQIPHRALVNFLTAMCAKPGMDAQDTLLSVTTVSFDIAGLELYLPLLTGARMVLIDRVTATDGIQLAATMERTRTSMMQATPATWRLLLSAGWQGDPALTILCGGEALPSDVSSALISRTRTVWNMYGPTETTIWSTMDQVTDDAISIGRPIANTQTYILDEHLQPVPIGIPGELYIGGDGLAWGYRNRADLTAARFLPNPFSTQADARMYRTGDLARHRADGRIEYLGRLDHQVKVRGYRIELGEIETVLSQHPAIQQAVVVAHTTQRRDQQLVAYVQSGAGDLPLTSELRAFLQQKLPEYMVPSAFIPLQTLPLTPNGKIDRRVLPAPDRVEHDITQHYVAPRSQMEQTITQIWSAILEREQVGIYDDFFHVGGHSLLAMQVLSRIRDELSVDLPLRMLFEARTIAALAPQLETLQSPAERVPLLQPADRTAALPLSFAQERLWFLDRFMPQSPFYNIALILRLEGPLNVAVLQQSLDTIVARHEALRTTFDATDGQPQQIIHDQINIPLSILDLSELPEALLQECVSRPFDLTRGPLLYITLLRLNQTNHVLVLTMHHIISDGWSIELLSKELTELYGAFCAGKPSPLLPLPLQYPDFAVWQRAWLDSAQLDHHIAYWRNQLVDAPTALELPTDRPRPPLQTFNGATFNFTMPTTLTHQVKALAQEEDATLFIILLAAFQVLLARYSGQNDIVVGSPIANRDRSEVEALIGFFVNTLVLRSRCSGGSFRKLLWQVRETALDAYAHQNLPFEKIVEELQPTRDMSRNVLFQVFFMLQRDPVAALGLPGLQVSPMWLSNGTTQFDLTLGVTDTDEELYGWLEYNTDLYDTITIARMATCFQNLLEGIVAHPDQHISDLPLLTQTERTQILEQWNASSIPLPLTGLVHQLFEQQVMHPSNEIALVYEDCEMPYVMLQRRSNQLAHYLRLRGVGPEVRVGLCFDRSVEMVVALLGVLKAGGAYVPLSPNNARERLAFMLHDAKVDLVLTLHGHRVSLPESTNMVALDQDWPTIAQHSDEALPNSVTGHNLAYIIYTSGSIGQPKGVMVTHESLANAYQAWEAAYQLRSATSCHLQMASIAFDVCTGDIVRALCSGATLVLCPPTFLLDPKQLYQLIIQHQVDCAEFVPIVIRNLMQYLDETSQRLDTFRVLAVGSDTWFMREYRALRQLCGSETRLVSSYGLTEATIDSTYFEPTDVMVSDDRLVPIGRPFAGTQSYVFDKQLQPVPPGVIGELYLGGVGLARGYLGQSALTAARCVPHPFSTDAGARLYQTGDRARYLPDGTIEFIARSDGQVKIRGFRIELSEIEAVLRKHPDVADVAVVDREDVPGDKRLIAYIVTYNGPPSSSELRDFVRQQLPDYMLPSAFVPLAALPFNVNGKLDRQALPIPDSTRPELAADYVAPRSTAEEVVAEIWSTLLGVDQVGVYDDFFDLGGHSLLAMRVVSRIRDAFEIELPLRSLFEATTVFELAEVVEEVLLAELEELSEEEAEQLLSERY